MSTRRIHTDLVVLALLAGVAAGPRCAVAAGKAAGLSPQQQVNQTELGYQGEPDVALLADGGFVVAWRTNDSHDWVRTFDAAGVPTSDEMQLTTVASARNPRIERLSDDRLIVVWDYDDIWGRFLDADGVPSGTPFQINQETTGVQRAPDVATASNGSFLVTWTSSVSNGGDDSSYSVQARLFDSGGTPITDEFQINTVTEGSQGGADVVALVGGGFVAAWESATSTGDDNNGASIQFRKIGANGVPIGVDVQANVGYLGNQSHPDIAPLAGGGFAIIWESAPPTSTPTSLPEGNPTYDGIVVRLFDSDGQPSAAETPVSTSGSSGGSVTSPVIESGAGGLLVATWYESAAHIVGRVLVPRDPIVAGDEFQIDDYESATSAYYPRATLDEAGILLVAWEGNGSPGGDDSDDSVQLRRMTLGRVAHWALEEGFGGTANDSAGQVNDDGIIAGDTPWVSGRPGHGALSFGGNSVVSFGTSSDLTITDSTVSIAAWIWLDHLPSESTEPFEGIYDSAEDAYVLYLDRDQAELRFKVTDDTGTAERPGIPESALDVHRWIYVVGVYDGDAAVAEIYLDGVLKDSHANVLLVDPVDSTPAQLAAMGADGGLDQYRFHGRIDNLEIWRTALSEPQIDHLLDGWIFGDGFEGNDKIAWSSSTP